MPGVRDGSNQGRYDFNVMPAAAIIKFIEKLGYAVSTHLLPVFRLWPQLEMPADPQSVQHI